MFFLYVVEAGAWRAVARLADYGFACECARLIDPDGFKACVRRDTVK